MKALITGLLFFVLPVLLISQEQPSAIDLSNGIRKDLRKDNPDEAVAKSLLLIDLKSTYLVDIIHSNVTNQIKKANEDMLDLEEVTEFLFLTKLDEQGNSKISKVIHEELAWAMILNASKRKLKLKLANRFAENQVDTVNYPARAQRYALLIAEELNPDIKAELRTLKLILDNTIHALQSNPYLDRMGPKAYDELLASWSRFILASAYFQNSTLDPNTKGENLKLAAKYSAGPGDAAFKSYVQTDYYLLTGSYQKKGFRQDYLDFLLENELFQESLSIKADLCLLNPRDENFIALRDEYSTTNKSNIGFNEFWKDKVLSVCKPLPVNEFVCPEDSLSYPIGDKSKWTFVDVWGSWCSPCVEEFPSLQEAYSKNLKQANSNLIITTWAFDNPEPMQKLYEKEGYTVPYTHIDNDLQTLFHIHSWPTKMLISPEGKYLKIPYGVDWQEFVKNYIQALE